MTSTSGTYAFSLSSGGIILQAYRRIGIKRTEVDREKLTDANVEMNALFSERPNCGSISPRGPG